VNPRIINDAILVPPIHTRAISPKRIIRSQRPQTQMFTPMSTFDQKKPPKIDV
jgi:hypothetical protein